MQFYLRCSSIDCILHSFEEEYIKGHSMSTKSIPLIKLPWDARGLFKTRPNRYLGVVDLIYPQSTKAVKVHIHDPGRLRELLYPENQVLLREVKAKNRKTAWDIIAGKHQNQWVLVHSGYHRRIVEQILQNPELTPFKGMNAIEAEVTYGESRIDFLLQKNDRRRIWLEVKGCTLARNGVALFPDAPTKRGCKHLKSLMKIKEDGMEAAILILVFRTEALCFSPNREIDPEFAELFYEALRAGVKVYPMVLRYENETIFYTDRIHVCLKPH